MPPAVLFLRATPLDPDPRVDKLARSLAANGYPVQALGWNRDGDLPAAERVNGIPYLRLPVRAKFGRGLRNVTHQIRWQIALLAWLFRHRGEYDILHACDFDTVLPALVARRLWRKKVVYDIFDFYADMLRATPGAVKTVIRWLDLRAIGAADAVVLADDSRTAQIAGSHPKRLAVIYNALDDRPVGQASERPPNSRLHLVYVGNLQIERGLLPLLSLLRRRPEWTLALAGFGGDEARIRGEASGLANVSWHGQIPYDQALRLEAAADALIATYDPAIPNHRFSSPNKVFEAMLLAKPVLAARCTNVDVIVEKAGCGLVVDYGDEAALENALLRLQEDDTLRKELGANARRAFETTYNWETMQARLLALYQEI